MSRGAPNGTLNTAAAATERATLHSTPTSPCVTVHLATFYRWHAKPGRRNDRANYLAQHCYVILCHCAPSDTPSPAALIGVALLRVQVASYARLLQRLHRYQSELPHKPL